MTIRHRCRRAGVDLPTWFRPIDVEPADAAARITYAEARCRRLLRQARPEDGQISRVHRLLQPTHDPRLPVPTTSVPWSCPAGAEATAPVRRLAEGWQRGARGLAYVFGAGTTANWAAPWPRTCPMPNAGLAAHVGQPRATASSSPLGRRSRALIAAGGGPPRDRPATAV